jgi:FkbM family methyltransferase
MTKFDFDNKKITSYLDGDKITLLDIGARYGIHPRWNKIAPHLIVYAFEPDAKESQRINEKAALLPYQLQCLPLALGSNNGDKITLYLCKDPGSSSLYEPNTDLVSQFYFAPNMEVIDTSKVRVNRLDKICRQKQLKPDVIKIDTQGFELEILKGAGTAVLNNVKLVELEVEFNEQYKNQPLFSHVDLFMRKNGFVLLGLRRSYWRRKLERDCLKTPFGGQIMHGDAVYYNESLLNVSQSTKDLIKFCIIFGIYQQDDLVGYLLSKPHSALRGISETERTEIAHVMQNKTKTLTMAISKMLDLVRSKLYLPHTALRAMLDKLQSKKSIDWHDPNFY